MKKLPLLLLAILIYSCSAPWKAELVESGSQDDMIRNCVIDFMHSSFVKKDTFDVYEVFILPIQYVPGVTTISIEGLDRVDIWPEDTVGSESSNFYKKYIEFGGKLFVWEDDETPLNQEIFERLNKYDIPKRKFKQYLVINDDRVRDCAYYYICDNDFKRYKKRITDWTKRKYTGLKCK